jgi:VWFA-related protein
MTPEPGIRTRRMRRSNPAVCLTLAFSLAAQQPPPAPPPAETFRAVTRLVVLDVVVTDRSGHPVKNRQREDFTVFEDGARQTVSLFESAEQRSQLPAVAEGKHGAVLVPAPPEQSALSPSAISVLVLDELNSDIHDQAEARVAIQKFLKTRGPQLNQPTALMLLGQKRLELLHDYTQNANALLAALNQRHAELPFGLMTSETYGAGERFGKTLWALQQIGDANAHFGGRKNVIWVGPGFPAINELRRMGAARWNQLEDALGKTASMLWEARVAVYTLNPKGLEVTPEQYASLGINSSALLVGTQDQATGDLLFEGVALQTGGRILRLRNDLDLAIGESMDDGESYYTLAYYPNNRDWHDQFRSVRVIVRGESLQARTRPGYFATAERAPTDDQIQTILSRAVMNPVTFKALQFSVATTPARGISVRYLIKVDRRGLEWQTLPNGKRRCEITAVTANVGSGDNITSHRVRELESLVDGKHFEAQWDKPVTFELGAQLPPDTRQVRIVIRDMNNGRIGSTDLSRERLPLR